MQPALSSVERLREQAPLTDDANYLRTSVNDAPRHDSAGPAVSTPLGTLPSRLLNYSTKCAVAPAKSVSTLI
jgi:hypothetical protein